MHSHSPLTSHGRLSTCEVCAQVDSLTHEEGHHSCQKDVYGIHTGRDRSTHVNVLSGLSPGRLRSGPRPLPLPLRSILTAVNMVGQNFATKLPAWVRPTEHGTSLPSWCIPPDDKDTRPGTVPCAATDRPDASLPQYHVSQKKNLSTRVPAWATSELVPPSRRCLSPDKHVAGLLLQGLNAAWSQEFCCLPLSTCRYCDPAGVYYLGESQTLPLPPSSRTFFRNHTQPIPPFVAAVQRMERLDHHLPTAQATSSCLQRVINMTPACSGITTEARPDNAFNSVSRSDFVVSMTMENEVFGAPLRALGSTTCYTSHRGGEEAGLMRSHGIARKRKPVFEYLPRKRLRRDVTTG